MPVRQPGPGLRVTHDGQRVQRVTSDGCIYCAFLEKRAKEGQKVYEDSDVYAILDDYPISQGHTLVILKRHRKDLAAVSPAEAGHLGKTVARLSKALKEAFGAEYVYVASLGEQIQHVHYHLIPRYETDKNGFVHFLSQRGRLSDANELVARVTKELASLLDNSSLRKPKKILRPMKPRV